MFGETTVAHQQAVGELSPPYDGSEMDLFPDLSFLDSVQSDFLNTGFDEIASLPPPLTSDNAEHSDQEDQPEPVLQGIVSPNNNPTLLPDSPKGKSVIKVIVNSSKDETELVKYLMGKDHNGPPPKLTIVKKLNSSSASRPRQSPDFIDDVTTTSHPEAMKIDKTLGLPVVDSSNIKKSLRPNKTKSKKEISLIEQLEKELQVCDPINRNAIAARLNRLRKKNHVEALEESVKNLQTENSELFEQNKCLNAKVSSLETEVNYLKSILANQSSLSSLLSNIQATNLNFHTSMDTVQNIPEEDIDTVFESKTDEEEIDVVGMTSDQSTIQRKTKRRHAPDNNEEIDKKKARKESASVDRIEEQQNTDTQATAGVCLHVSGKNVSLEFCSHCSQKAQTIIQMSKPRPSNQLIKTNSEKDGLY